MSSIGGGVGGLDPFFGDPAGLPRSDVGLVGRARISRDGQVLIDGWPVDLGTAAGVAALRGAVDDQGLATVKALLRLKEVPTADGPVLVRAIGQSPSSLASGRGGNVLELVLLVLRESIKEMTEDKKYFLQKLQALNRLADRLSEYLSSLVSAAQDLATHAAGAECSETSTAPPPSVGGFASVGRECHPKDSRADDESSDCVGLGDVTRELEAVRELLRDKRQADMTALQNVDQQLMDDVAKDFASMQASHQRIVQAGDRLARLALQATQETKAQADRLQDLVRAKSPESALLEAAKQMQETQMSFNLQYLQLQSQMQHENRSYTAISNIMKTKHDTVKNSISNVR